MSRKVCRDRRCASSSLGQELHQLVAEDGDAARLEADDRGPRRDLRAQDVEDLAQLALRQVEHAVVVERPAAAERARRDRHVEAGGLEHLDRGPGGLGMEVVVEGVRPEEHAGRARRSVSVAAASWRRTRRVKVCGREARDARAAAPCRRPPWRARARPGVWVTKLTRRGARRGQARPPVDEAQGVGRCAGAGAARSSATGTRPCRSPCRRSPGSRPCSPCRRGRGRAPP